jgi:hypothetical protein
MPPGGRRLEGQWLDNEIVQHRRERMKFLEALLTRRRLIILLVCLAVASAGLFFLIPSFRVGPFGLGLPAPWTRLEVTSAGLCIRHPDSWVGSETPQGNHGDLAVLAVIGVPGRRWPQALVLRGSSGAMSLSALVEWAQERARGHEGYSPLDSQPGQTSGLDGQVSEYRFAASGLLGTTQVRCNDLSFVAASGGFVLNMCSEVTDWPTVEPVFREMVATLGTVAGGGEGCPE